MDAYEEGRVKICTKCGEERALSDYGSFSQRGSIFTRGECNYCRRVKEAARRNADLEACRAYDRERYAKNEQRRAVMKARALAWTKAHPEGKRRTGAQRRALKRATWDGVKIDRQEIFDRDGGRCHICGKKVGAEWHLDHLVPIAKGGAHVVSNLRVAHPSCNTSRGAGRTPAQLLLT